MVIGELPEPVKTILGSAVCPIFGVINIFLSEFAIYFTNTLPSLGGTLVALPANVQSVLVLLKLPRPKSPKLLLVHWFQAKMQ
jgi:hypothetical protein